MYRTCTVPANTYLFFPLLNDEFDNLTCGKNGKPTSAGFTADQLTAAAKTTIDNIVSGSMSATVDGASVSGLQNANSPYRSPSPWFSYTLPKDNVGQFFGCKFPKGTVPPSVDNHAGATADGVYLMLAPLTSIFHAAEASA